MGGGGNDGYEQRQADIEAKKQSARDMLNAQFGVGASSPAPDRAAFTKKIAPSPSGLGGWTQSNEPVPMDPEAAKGFDVFDQGGFDAAQQNYEQGKVNGAGREQIYQTVRDNAYNAGKRRLDEQKTEAGRKLKFELFARGLNGGSEDVNQNALLGRTYNDGVMDLGAKADAAKATFRGNDESTRLSLLQAIDSGTDQGSAISSAMNQMNVNADRAAADANGTTVGDLFNTGSLLYNRSKAAEGKAAGTDWWNTYAPAASKSKTSGATGTVYSGAGV